MGRFFKPRSVVHAIEPQRIEMATRAGNGMGDERMQINDAGELACEQF